jgi:hypothetical protein
LSTLIKIYNKLKVINFSLRRSLFSHGKKETTEWKIFYFLFSAFPKILLSCRKFFSIFSSNQIEDLIYLQKKSLDLIFCFANKKLIWEKLPSIDPKVLFLRENGYLKYTNIEISDLLEIENLLKKKIFYKGNVPIGSDFKKIYLNNYTSYYSTDSLFQDLERSLVNVVSNCELQKIIDSYLGGDSRIYSINTMVTLPSTHLHSVTNLHRDFDDVNFLSVFIYWTEADEMNGATYYCPGTNIGHLKNDNSGLYLSGKAGSVYIIDPQGLHKGNIKVKSPRVVTWIRYSKNIFNLASITNKDYLYFKDYEKLRLGKFDL